MRRTGLVTTTETYASKRYDHVTVQARDKTIETYASERRRHELVQNSKTLEKAHVWMSAKLNTS